MKEFLYLTSLEGFYRFLENFQSYQKYDEIDIEDSCGRVVAENLKATEDIPSYNRSSVDGYAVKFQNTSGASYSSPVILENIGEIEMGQRPSFSISDGQTAYIPTGGALPDGADAVIMIENTEKNDKIVEVYKQASFQENLILQGEDFKKGRILFEKGTTIHSKDVGALASMGIKKVKVFALPKVHIFSTGNEIVSVKTDKYQIRDSNSYVVHSMLKKISRPVRMGILKDDYNQIYKAVSESYDQSDVIVLSGGSSMGVRDYTLEIFKKFGDPIYQLHGIRIKPGKPTIVYITKEKVFVGLPGHPVSSFVSSLFVLMPLIKKLSGHKRFTLQPQKSVKSKIRMPSQEGRADFYRVRLINDSEFEPIFAQSSSISSLLYCDGIVKIDEDSEGIYEGETVPYYDLEDI